MRHDAVQKELKDVMLLTTTYGNMSLEQLKIAAERRFPHLNRDFRDAQDAAAKMTVYRLNEMAQQLGVKI